MLKRLKLKSLLPSSALRSNSAALRLSKTPPQGGVFVSGAELFPGWRLTPYPGYKCSKASLRAAKPNTAPAVAPVSNAPPGDKRCQCRRPAISPPRHRSGRQNQIPHLPVAPVSNAPPGDKRCQCRRPAISLPRHRSGRQNPNTAPAIAPVSNAPPGDKRCQCRRPDRRSSDQRFFMSAIDLCRVNGRHKKTTPPEGGVAVVNTGLCLTSCRSLSA